MWLVTLRQRPFAADELADLRDLSPRAVYRWAIARGWSADEAGNWSAFCIGLKLTDGEDWPRRPWTVEGLQRLLWLRWMVATGVMPP